MYEFRKTSNLLKVNDVSFFSDQMIIIIKQNSIIKIFPTYLNNYQYENIH